MPVFRYRAVTPAGEVVVGEVEAPTREEVMRRIEYLGHLPIEAEPAGKRIFELGKGPSARPPRAREITVFMRQLAVLVGAGLTLEAALQTLSDDAEKSAARFAAGLRSSIASGESFADALETRSGAIEPAYVAMIRAGEASGKLDVVLRAIVEDRTRREALTERIRAAVGYPLFLIGAAVVILFFFMLYVVPQFEPVFRDLGGRLNAGAAFVLTVSTGLRAHLDLVLGGMLASVLVLWWVLHARERRARILAVLAAIPGVAGTVRDRQTARIIATLGLLVANGVALPAALKILREVVGDPRQVAAVDRLHEQVRNGRRFTEALADSELLPPLAVRMLRIGDETGDLPSIAAHAAHFYEQRLSAGLDRLMGAVGPAAIILVSVVIGALIISIMSALLSITELAR